MTLPTDPAENLAALIRCASVTPAEGGALSALEKMLKPLGFSVERPVFSEGGTPDVENLYARRSGNGPHLMFAGHTDVVPVGDAASWTHPPFSAAIANGEMYGRGAVDMKGAVVAALHALAALGGHAPHGEVVLVAVGSEEDGGLGTFAALERDAAFDACLIPEPTGFDVVCAQAGALTFEGVVRGVAAHAAHRLEGVSAIDRYLPVHAALAAHEEALNADVEHPLMRALELAYPLLVGRLQAGEWSSSVPDRLVFEGRAPVRVGEAAAARAAVEAAVAAAGDGHVELRWTGGQFASGETPADHPFARLSCAAVAAEIGREPRFAGVPWGADMRLWCTRGIPCVMAGPSGIELAHAVDERVRIDELLAVARTIVRVAYGFAAGSSAGGG